jgi:hypothetical protein
VKVTSVVPSRKEAVAAAVALTTQFPSPVYVKTPVDVLTSHVVVVLLIFEYVIDPSPSVEARVEGVNGD